MPSNTPPPVVLFGYDASTFTIKIRYILRLKQIPYTFIAVPSMMPRPQLLSAFHLTYRKIPILAIGHEIYCDTSLITEALEHFFPVSEGYRSIYPIAADGRDYRPLIRGFASYWTDRPLFRVTTGLIPASVWRSPFGVDRANLIGHTLDADKLERKLPENLARLDMQLSMLEPLFSPSTHGISTSQEGPWIFTTPTPSLADISLYYQLFWGNEISSGSLVYNLTGGNVPDSNANSSGSNSGTSSIFNAQRYPGVWSWYRRMQAYFDHLPPVEDRDTSFEETLSRIRASAKLGPRSLLLPTPRDISQDLDAAKLGLTPGALVSVVPDDTGRDDPTIGTLVAVSPEEVVITPRALETKRAAEEAGSETGDEKKTETVPTEPLVPGVRIHFPRLGFVVRPVAKVEVAKL